MCSLDVERRNLVENNMGLVYFVLKKAGISQRRNDYDDIFGAGCLGLCNAASVWRSDGSPFSTFAYHLIRHEVIRAAKRSYRDSKRLLSLDEFCEYAAAPDLELEKKEAKMLMRDFLRNADKLLGEYDAKIIRLAADGEDCQQIADTLGEGISAVYKSKKRARAVIDSWLHKGE